MGIKSMLFGKKPKFVERSSGEQRLLGQARGDLAAAQRMTPGAQAALARAGDDAPATRRARSTANADIMQSTSAPAFDPANPNRPPQDRALGRARALSRIGWAGADLAQNQGFQQRLGLAQYGRAASRGVANSANMTLSDLQYQTRATDNYISAVDSATKANVIGTLAGAGGAAYGEYRRNQPPGVNPNAAFDFSTIRTDPNRRVV